MKKRAAVCILVLMSFMVLPGRVYAKSFDSGDSVIDKVSDWAATLGKSPEDRDMIIGQRKTERVAKRMGNAVKSGAKKAGKEMKEMGKMFDNN